MQHANNLSFHFFIMYIKYHLILQCVWYDHAMFQAMLENGILSTNY